MKLSIQLHLAGLSLSNTVSVLEVFGVQRARSTVHNWVHKADLQPEDCQPPDHVSVNETVIQLNDEQYWLYAAVDTETNKLLHTKLRPTTTKVFAHSFLTELDEKHDVDDAVFLVDGSKSLEAACHRHGFDFRYKTMEIGTLSDVSLEKQNVELFVSQTVSATPKEKLLTSGSDHSLSHGISLSEHYRLPRNHSGTACRSRDSQDGSYAAMRLVSSPRY